MDNGSQSGGYWGLFPGGGAVNCHVPAQTVKVDLSNRCCPLHDLLINGTCTYAYVDYVLAVS